MISRKITRKLALLASEYKAISIVGPRQTGKTTLCKSFFPNKSYVNLENLQTRNYALEDPVGFLGQYKKDGAILDEIQRFPELFSYLQEEIDNSTKKQNTS